MKILATILAAVLVCACQSWTPGRCKATSLELRSGGAAVIERNFALLGERDVRTTETLTFHADGITTRSISRAAECRIGKQSIVNGAGVLATAIGAIAGALATGR